MAAVDPSGLITDVERATRRRRQTDLLLVAAPPLLALAAAAAFGRLPVELAAAGLIGAAFLVMFVSTVEVGKIAAASFLDRALAAKDHFLTLATIDGDPALRGVVASGASALVARQGMPTLPPRRTRPIVASSLASAALLLLLWMLPALAPLVSSESPLDRIASTLVDSTSPGDHELATELRIVARALRDPSLSNQQKLEKVQAALDKIAKAEQAREQQGQGSSSGSSGGSGGKSEQSGKDQSGGAEKGQGQSQGAAGKTEGQQGDAGNASARGAAKQELSKIAGELQGEQAKGSQPKKADSKQGEQKKQDPAGGGIQGPESGAEERKPGDRESNSNQPGKSPDKPGGDQQQAGEGQGEGKSQQPNAQQPGQSQGQGAGPGAGTGEGASNRPSHAPDTKQAERYYKPGEGPGEIVDGKYVTIRVPEDRQRLEGTERVAKPGDVELEVGYGNAPLPSAGSPGEVSVDQPIPLEYRAALGGAPK